MHWVLVPLLQVSGFWVVALHLRKAKDPRLWW
jgi:hypothetical protein